MTHGELHFLLFSFTLSRSLFLFKFMRYDILVIGGGPAGYSAAMNAAQLGRQQGLSIGLVESHQLGGTCLNRGCIPTKALLDTAGILDSLTGADERGIDVSGSLSIDMQKVLRFKERVVKKLNMGIAVQLRDNGVPVIEGEATVTVSKNEFNVSITNGGRKQTLVTKKLIFAAGSRPMRISLTGADDSRTVDSIFSSDELLNLNFVPKKLLVLGGGVIGIEAARIFRSFGGDVHLVEALPRLLPLMDADVSDLLTKTLLARKIKVSTGVQATGVRAAENGLVLRLSNGEEIDGSHLLVAVGRSPNTAPLSPDLKSALQLDAREFIPVDHRMRTAVGGFFAPGDINGRCMLAHAAAEMGKIAAETAVEELGKTSDFRESPLEEYRRRILEKGAKTEIPCKDAEFFPFYVPSCVYGDPEIGAIGWTEEQAREHFGNRIRIGRSPFAANARAVVSGQQQGFAKVIRLTDLDRIIGVHLIGPGASETINEAAAYFSLGSSAAHWAATIHGHPTFSETLAEAVADSRR